MRVHIPNMKLKKVRRFTAGEESCWTCRDTVIVRSFGIFHNGGSAVAAQDMEISATNYRGDVIRAAVPLPSLGAFETVKFIR